MKRAWLVIAIVSTAASCSRTPGAKQPLSPKEIAERTKPAIVRVETQFAGGKSGVGTGFFVAANGKIITNLHVIVSQQLQPTTSVTVVLLDGTRYQATSVVGYDPERDLAVLTVDNRREFPFLPLGDSAAVSAGDPIVAIGNPLGVLDFTVSDGLISSIRQVADKLTLLQISAPISQGSSGGPLLNRFGEVVGVATLVSNEGQNLNFGVPSNYLRPLLKNPNRLSFAQLNTELKTRAAQAKAAQPKTTSANRKIPKHELTLVNECPPQSLITAYQTIDKAIRVGAPLYNQGNHEACFRIYEGAAMNLDKASACPGVSQAMSAGLGVARTRADFKAKAWAMRDAFDGVLDVIKRKAAADAAKANGTSK